MKKSLFILLLSITALGANSQRIKTTSIVKDSLGNQYPYEVWSKLNRSGSYIIRPVNPGHEDTEFLLVKLSTQQKNDRIEKMRKPKESEFFTTGEVIKPFKITDIYGNKLDARMWAGKTVVLNFWFIGCPPCRAEIPELNKIATKYANNDNVIFIAIALDQDFAIKHFLRTNPFGYVLVGDGQYYANKFKIHLFPTNVVIDKEGKVRYHTSGNSLNNPYWIDKTIEESESGKPLQL